MAQIAPQWEEIEEYRVLASKLIEKFTERFDHINADEIIAYGVVNKDRPEGKRTPYDMSGEKEPESFTNKKRIFIKFFMQDWQDADESRKLWYVFSALERIDKETPGKIAPFDYNDQAVMVRTLGPDWQRRPDLPNLLKEDVRLVDTPDEEEEE